MNSNSINLQNTNINNNFNVNNNLNIENKETIKSSILNANYNNTKNTSILNNTSTNINKDLNNSSLIGVTKSPNCNNMNIVNELNTINSNISKTLIANFSTKDFKNIESCSKEKEISNNLYKVNNNLGIRATNNNSLNTSLISQKDSNGIININSSFNNFNNINSKDYKINNILNIPKIIPNSSSNNNFNINKNEDYNKNFNISNNFTNSLKIPDPSVNSNSIQDKHNNNSSTLNNFGNNSFSQNNITGNFNSLNKTNFESNNTNSKEIKRAQSINFKNEPTDKIINEDNHNINNTIINDLIKKKNGQSNLRAQAKNSDKIEYNEANNLENKKKKIEEINKHRNINGKDFFDEEKFENKIKRIIKSTTDEEIMKMKQFIHEEICGLHFDLIKQFEIQNVMIFYLLFYIDSIYNKFYFIIICSKIKNILTKYF